MDHRLNHICFFLDILGPSSWIGSWIKGHNCPLGGLPDGTLFHGDMDLTLAHAKTRCASGCDARDDCRFADLYYTEDLQECRLKGSGCGGWQTSTHWAYHLYQKGTFFYQEWASLI